MTNRDRWASGLDHPVRGAATGGVCFASDVAEEELAWRFHQRWPGLRGPLRQAVLERFADMTLGNMLQQLTDG